MSKSCNLFALIVRLLGLLGPPEGYIEICDQA